MLWSTPDHLRKVFVKINDYPSKTVESIIKNKLEKENVGITNEQQINATDNSETKLQLFRYHLEFCSYTFLIWRC